MARSILGFALTVLLCLAAIPALAAGLAFIEVPADPAQPDVSPALEGAVWTPCAAPSGQVPVGHSILPGVKDCPIEGRNLPLVVVSHGFGGFFLGHHDTAEALADAGFIVAAINHPSDSGRTPESQHKPPLQALTDRPADIKRLIDFMLGGWPGASHIDRDRIGFFGFSRGGFTGLALIGGNPDFARAIAEACPEGSMVPGCPEARKEGPPAQPLTHDPRIKAAVIADPLFGRFFDLTSVRIPVQLWASEQGGDGVLPNDGAAVAANLPMKPDYRSVPNSAHFVFLAPCLPQQAQAAPQICTDRAGFDRAAFHARFNADVVAFFRAHLVSQP